MSTNHPLPAVLAATLALALAGCASLPMPEIQRRAAEPAAAPLAMPPAAALSAAGGEAILAAAPRATAQLFPGQRPLIDLEAASVPPPPLPAAGEATFNFEGESLHAVVKAILGDLLQQNYVIAPNVQGTVTLATPRPVSPAQALSLLEMVLGWNNARLVWGDGRYVILPADQAVAGQLSPRIGPAAGARGLELRAVPLRYVSAAEMEKLLEPYVRPGGIVQVDHARNLVVLAGSRAELENYLRTIAVFDVDWLAGMSVGVFPLQSAEPERIITALEEAFGKESGSPLAGMFRFLPVEGGNSIIVITPQARYLERAREWIERLDLAGEGSRLFVYEVKYMEASDLAAQLGAVFGAEVSAAVGDPGPDLAPGLTPIGVGAVSRPAGQFARPRPAPIGTLPAAAGAADSAIGISAIEQSNALMIRASPAQWDSIRRAIERLDVMPAQVHIEAQVLEVRLTGNLQYGVNWFFDNDVPGALRALRAGRSSLGMVAGSIATDNAGLASLALTLASGDAAAIVGLLERESDVRVLSTPSLFVRNNGEAALNVGQSLAVQSTTFAPGVGTGLPGTPGTNVVASVQYLSTGTKLRVRPRIGGDGMVFLAIEQEISSPSEAPGVGGNPNVDTSTVSTEALVRDGETVMLAGLIRESDARGSSGAPGLSRLPFIGGLFGQQTRSDSRSEVVLLITPRVVRSPEALRNLTDDYIRRFQGLGPIVPAAVPPPPGSAQDGAGPR